MAKFTKGLGIVALAMVLNLGAAQARRYGGGWHGGGHYYGAIAEATMVAVGVGADLPPVQFSADCSLRPTITDRRPVTITNSGRRCGGILHATVQII